MKFPYHLNTFTQVHLLCNNPSFHSNTDLYFRLIHMDGISCLFMYSPASWNSSSENPGRYRGSSDDVLHLLTASSQDD